MAPHSSTLAWEIPWMEEPGRLQSMGSLRVGHDWATSLSLFTFTFTFHFHALEKEMATHSSVLAWRIPGTGKPGGLLSMGSHRVWYDWCDLAAAAYMPEDHSKFFICVYIKDMFSIFTKNRIEQCIPRTNGLSGQPSIIPAVKWEGSSVMFFQSQTFYSSMII